MEGKHRDILKKNFIQLTHDLKGKDVARYLYANDIFSQSDKSQVDVIQLDLALNEKVLDLLTKRGPTAYGIFMDFLEEEQPHLYELLLKAEGKKVPSSGNDSSTDTVSEVINKDVHKATTSDEKPAKSPVPESSQEDGGGHSSKDNKDSDHSDGNKTSKSGHNPGTQIDGVNESDIYSMKNHPRGRAFIINNKIFKPSSGMDKYPRNGTDIDAKALEKLFIRLGFKTEVKHNVNTVKTKDLFERYANMDSSSYDCFMCAVLTHGEEGIIYTEDGKLQIKELTAKFRGKFLGKPKLFFFQACQGFEYMDGTDHTDGPGQDEIDEVDAPGSNKITLPVEADFLYAYSTVPGYYSWRNSARGSWFVQAIVSVFDRHKHNMDVLSMMTRVNREVAWQKSNTNESFSDNKKQIPCIITQLRKELYFFPQNLVGQM